MANIEVKKVEEQLNQGSFSACRVNADEAVWSFRSASRIRDRRLQTKPPSSPLRLPSRKSSRRRRNPVRRQPQRIAERSICGHYEDDVASRLSRFEPEIGLIGFGWNKGGIVGRDRVASPSSNRVIRSAVANIDGPSSK